MGKEMIEWIVALAKGIIIAIILTVFIGTSYTCLLYTSPSPRD